MSTKQQIILLAHGSSDQRWCDTFEKLAQPTLDSVPGSRVAYMELSSPSLQETVAEGVAQGIKKFTVVPLFLAAGRHLRKDVPGILEELEQEHSVSITLQPPVGENPELGHAIRDVVKNTLAEV
jgi:sirohydrochlorin cobaltochelatase